MHEKKIARIYMRELFGALAIYAVMLIVTIKFGRGMADGLPRTLVLASPMIGFFLAIWAVARQLKRIDEYVRQRILESLALASAITVGITFTYGFLETAGYPRISMFTVWGIMGTAWLLAVVAGCLRNR